MNSRKPVGYFTHYDPQHETPYSLHFLQDKYGSYLQGMGYSEKVALLAIITRTLAVDAQFGDSQVFTLEDAWAETGYDLSPELGGLLETLNDLDDDNLYGLCQCLIDNRHDEGAIAA